MRHVGVVDIGKTNAKFAVVDTRTMAEVAVRTQPNSVRNGPPYPHFDIEGIWDFLTGAIADLNRDHPLDALSITTHGATAALVDADGGLALPVLDYEHDGPDALRDGYDALCPPFAVTLTPKLPLGLNLGAQLYYQQHNWPDAFSRAAAILTYPQYWAFRLTGVMASELTSLGCHTGLWDFQQSGFSALAEAMDISEKFPPVRPAFDVLGPVRAELAAKLRLKPDMPVYCGIHDSNASLLPQVLNGTPPFSVVSTGTWVIVCSPGGSIDTLDEKRDCLANIDALGRTVPSARFMGGREFSMLTDNRIETPSPAQIARVLDEKIMLLPSVQQGSGPFPGRKAGWSHTPQELYGGARYAAISFYLALMTAECLALTGAGGEIVVEGPFARNPQYLAMLTAAARRPVKANAQNATGTSTGAALLALGPDARPALDYAGVDAGETGAAMADYARAWRAAVEG